MDVATSPSAAQECLTSVLDATEYVQLELEDEARVEQQPAAYIDQVNLVPSTDTLREITNRLLGRTKRGSWEA